MNKYLKHFVHEKFNHTGKALDLGAGSFYDVHGLNALGWKCKGVDVKTGIDLESRFVSKYGPFDLVYSNYVIHKIQNKENFIRTMFDNLRDGGWFFLHTFDKSDVTTKKGLSNKYLKDLLSKQGFKYIKINVFDYYDNEKGHEHLHKVLEASGQK